jgi:hypothetical protein
MLTMMFLLARYSLSLVRNDLKISPACKTGRQLAQQLSVKITI